MCKVSFVTSVYNCEKFIAETIQGVIDQSFKDWEYIIIDDNSSDKSAEIISSFKDKRIIFIHNDVNKGQVNNLNHGISLAKGEYIARLDHDDICYPDRVAIQNEYMDNHPDTVLCGTWKDIWKNNKIYHDKCPTINNPKEHKFSFAFDTFSIAHSSFFIRKNTLTNNNIKYRDYKYAEDADLIYQLKDIGNIDFIKEPLIAYRVFPEQFTQICEDELVMNEKKEIQFRYFDEADISCKEILKKAVGENLENIDDYKEFENAIVEYAKYCGINDADSNECVVFVFKEVCKWQDKTIDLYNFYRKSRLKDNNWIKSIEGIKFLVKCFIKYNRR